MKMPTQTLEPRIESSLLYTREDGTQAFVHDTYRDFFMARWLAARINSERLSISDAWINYWSYEEDAELWGLPQDREWRALLPNWKDVLVYLTRILHNENEKCVELIDVITKNFFKYEEQCGATKNEKSYNPFFGDLIFSSAIIENSKNRIKTEKVTNVIVKIITDMESSYREFINENLINELFFALARINDDRAFDFFIGCINERFYKFSNLAFDALVKIGSENVATALIGYIKTDGTPFKLKAAEALQEIGVDAGFFYENIEFYTSSADLDLERELNISTSFCELLAFRHDRLTSMKDPLPNLLKEMMSNEDYESRLCWLFESFSYATDAICETLEKTSDKRAIKPLMRMLDSQYTYYIFSAIYSIHQRLKPQGYNPSIKKLSA